MVKQRRKNSNKRPTGKGFIANGAQARKIDASPLWELNSGGSQRFGLQAS